jgi:outer membrane protein assembly factor BamD (BamD/ComL family)
LGKVKSLGIVLTGQGSPNMLAKKYFPQRIWLALAALSIVCATGCQSLKSKQAKSDLDAKYADDERAKPWVKEVSTASYLPSSDEQYLLDRETNDKLKTKVKTMMGQGPDQARAMKTMSDADVLFESAAAEREQNQTSNVKEQFVSAAKLYKEAAERWPKSSLEQDALFRAGESYFFADQYVEANDCYEKLIAKYRGTRYVDVVQSRRFTIAKYWLDLNRESPDQFYTYRLNGKLRPRRNTAGHALRILDRIRLDDPTGKLADDATLALANGYFERKRYLDASDTYEDLRRTYPNSEHVFNAHLFELRSRLESYHGENYDGGNLIKAEKLLKTMVTQFPAEAEEHREFLTEEAGRVRKLQAERELSMAHYYDNRGEYRAAGMHYEQLAKDFGDTPIGKAAQERMSEISDLPPEPPQRMSWLVNMFPQAESTKPLLPARDGDTLMR